MGNDNKKITHIRISMIPIINKSAKLFFLTNGDKKKGEETAEELKEKRRTGESKGLQHPCGLWSGTQN
jgi:hypothetical protein